MNVKLTEKDIDVIMRALIKKKERLLEYQTSSYYDEEVVIELLAISRVMTKLGCILEINGGVKDV